MDEIQSTLASYGITVDLLCDAAFECLPPISVQSDQKSLEERINVAFMDRNVSVLIMSAILLEEELIIKDPTSMYASDPLWLLADEIIGIAIAELIGGPKAKLAFTHYDQNKPGVLSTLGPFLDDAMAGLIAGCMVSTW
ncbi:MAG: phosphatidylglycerophosphatase A [Euryarchaeota archaeon]|nr:phosphatidylglycerophosphatase A [Euryarchaeota archaeon]